MEARLPSGSQNRDGFMREGLTSMRLVRDFGGTKLAMEGLILSHKLVNIIQFTQRLGETNRTREWMFPEYLGRISSLPVS